MREKLSFCSDGTRLKHVIGLILAALSSVFFAVSSLFVKLLRELPTQEVVFFRFFVQLTFLLPPLIYQEVPFTYKPKNMFYLIVRGAAGSLAICCQFYAFKHLPLADATVIVFTSPIFTGILAHFILGESWGTFDAVATILCFIGVILIACPTFLFTREDPVRVSGDWEQVIASLVALCGAVFVAIAFIAIRKLQGVSYLVPVFYLALVGVALTMVGLLATGSLTSVECGSYHQWLLLFLGLCGIGGQTLMTKALQTEKAAVVALVRTLDIVFAFVLQLVFLETRANLYSVGGAILVVSCNGVVIASRWRKRNKTEKREETDNLIDRLSFSTYGK